MFYAYRALSAGADTRIIALEPAVDTSSPLRCRMAELCLSSEDLIQYEALSYAWGEPDFSGYLYVVEDDGTMKILKIIPNLKNALQRLRLPDRQRLIWADAVCIDQQDNSDKEKQIPAMTQIYSSASCVLVWLGWSPEGQRALKYIKGTLRFHSKDDRKINEHMSNLAKAFHTLMRSPWFSRRWVIQEVVMAADVVIICGPLELPFVQLLRIMNGLLRDIRSPYPAATRTALEPLIAISKLWKTWVFDSNQNQGLRLFDLLNLFHDSGCAVDHDSVFALCNLASDCLIVDETTDEDWARDIMVVIDYNQPAERLFRSITEQMLGVRFAKEDQIGLMHLMGDPVFEEISDAVIQRCNGHYRSGLPPWTPDWCLPKRREAFSNFFDESFGKKKPYYGMLEHHRLELTGSERMGSITAVLEPFPQNPNMLNIKDWLQTMRSGFLKCTTDSQVQLLSFQPWLHQHFEIQPDHSPSGQHSADIHPDSAWCYFLTIIAAMTPPGTDLFDTYIFNISSSFPEPTWHHRDLYNLSLGRTDVGAGSESWSRFCSAFRGRRLFSFKVDKDPECSMFGVAIGPDHLAADSCFKVHEVSTRLGIPFHTLIWDPRAERAPALVGDVLGFIFADHWASMFKSRLEECDFMRPI